MFSEANAKFVQTLAVAESNQLCLNKEPIRTIVDENESPAIKNNKLQAKLKKSKSLKH